MAGSPEYLKQLTNVHKAMTLDEIDGLSSAWTLIDEIYTELEDNKNPVYLFDAAVAAFEKLAELREQTPEEIIEEARSLHIRKNAGYAGATNPDPWANFRRCERFGISALDGVFVRLSDKFIRMENLRADPNNDQVGEAITDTLADFAAYCLIGLCISEETNG